jgi:predicted nucleic acid-binding protein
MSVLYCDTSVLVAYYVPEVHSAKAEKILDGHPQRVVSTLVLTEASSALRRKVHDKTLSRADGQSAFDDLRQDVASGLFRLIEIERRHYDHAAQSMWTTTERLRTLDALHLSAVALDGMHLTTADGIMAKAGKELGVTIVWAA